MALNMLTKMAKENCQNGQIKINIIIVIIVIIIIIIIIIYGEGVTKQFRNRLVATPPPPAPPCFC